jgi:hypothetical protein
VINVANFTNLVRAYEFQLNQGATAGRIPANELRPMLLRRLQGTSPSEAYFILEGLAKTKSVAGDVCEFGVAQGETSALIANEIFGSNKVLHLFDSFEGLPKPSDKDRLKDDIFQLGSMEAYTGTMASPEELVLTRLAAIKFPSNRYVIHKGFFDQVLKLQRTTLPKSVSFAYVDFDFYEPIVQALQFVHDGMPVGGVIVVDDYDWFSTGAKTAVDEFMNVNDTSYNLFVPDKTLGCFAVLERVA